MIIGHVISRSVDRALFIWQDHGVIAGCKSVLLLGDFDMLLVMIRCITDMVRDGLSYLGIYRDGGFVNLK